MVCSAVLALQNKVTRREADRVEASFDSSSSNMCVPVDQWTPGGNRSL